MNATFEAPAIALGTFPLSGAFGHIDPRAVSRTLSAFAANGGNFYSTAAVYADGEVEAMLGQHLAALPRSSFAVATTCGYHLRGGRPSVTGEPNELLASVRESLRRLQCDYIDLIMIHAPADDTPLEESAEALQRLKERGLVKSIGVCNVTGEELSRYSSGAEIQFVQHRLSFINRSVNGDLSTVMHRVGARFIAHQVLERGLLTDRGVRLRSTDDIRAGKPEFRRDRSDWLASSVIPPVRTLAGLNGLTVEALMTGWVLHHPQVACAQLGASDARQAALLPTYARDLSPHVDRELEAIYSQAEDAARDAGSRSVRDFLGITDYDGNSGRPSGR